MGHADTDPVLVEDQRAAVVQAAPAGQHLLDTDLEAPGGLGRRRRVPLLHELPVDDLPELPQALLLVGLHGRSFRCAVPGRRVRWKRHTGARATGLRGRLSGPPTVGTCTG
jgi:hypothetical protein